MESKKSVKSKQKYNQRASRYSKAQKDAVDGVSYEIAKCSSHPQSEVTFRKSRSRLTQNAPQYSDIAPADSSSLEESAMQPVSQDSYHMKARMHERQRPRARESSRPHNAHSFMLETSHAP